jgi:DNA-binding response OmpR family regulator
MTANAKILVVDDEMPIRYTMQKTLARDGYQVTAVESGEQALQHLATQEFDLALIDLRLKGMDGLELLAELRRKYPATTVIILTAHASLETAVQALRQGAHDYLFKPCSTVELRESVRTGLLKRQQEIQRLELLARQPARPTEAAQTAPPSPVEPPPPQAPRHFLQYKGLIVDPIRHIITLEGQLLELSPTEFDLLAYLVNEAPRVVPPKELIREVQGYESDTWEARETVRSHVYHMRQKVKAATGQQLIRTVRGVGYTLDE